MDIETLCVVLHAVTAADNPLCCAVPGEPRKVKVEAINSTGIFVEWNKPKEEHGKIRGYQVFYIRVNSNDEPIPGSKEDIHDTYSGTLREAVITGLDADTRYLIQVAAYTRKGDGLRSKPRIITTKGAGKSLTVCTLSSRDVGMLVGNGSMLPHLEISKNCFIRVAIKL